MANFNFNKVILGGRLTSDPELSTTPNGAHVTKFGIAVNRRTKSDAGKGQTADFINITAWSGVADFITQYFHKGSSICIVGRIETRSWTDNHGNKHFATEVVAEEAMFVDAKGDKSCVSGSAAPVQTYMPESYSTPYAPAFDDITDDDQLPF